MGYPGAHSPVCLALSSIALSDWATQNGGSGPGIQERLKLALVATSISAEVFLRLPGPNNFFKMMILLLLSFGLEVEHVVDLFMLLIPTVL